jgi:hypothetical protein
VQLITVGVRGFWKLIIFEEWARAARARQRGIIDYGIQATFNYLFDDSFDSFSEAANPKNINWISVGISGLEGTIQYKNALGEYVYSSMISCFVNALSDNEGFKENVDVYGCGVGIVSAILGKQVAKYMGILAKYSRDQLRTGLAKIGIRNNQADEIIDKIKGGSGSSSAGTKIANRCSTNNNIDDLTIRAKDFSENLAELAKTNNIVDDASKKFWANHETNVTRYLRELYGNANVGRQITIDVKISGVENVVTCRVDNLVKVDNKFRIVDAKSSVNLDLSEVDVSTLISQRSTPNQKAFYEALRDGRVESIMPRGENARLFFDNHGGISSDGINIQNQMDFFVNDYATDGYNIFRKLFEF